PRSHADAAAELTDLFAEAVEAHPVGVRPRSPVGGSQASLALFEPDPEMRDVPMASLLTFPSAARTPAAPHELRGRDILCFSHDWTGDPLSKTHLMRLLARNNRVLWVNSIGYRTPTVSKADIGRAFRKLVAATRPMREVERNIFVLNPLAIPAYGWSMVRAFNQRLLRFQVTRAMRKLRFRRPINWVFNPAAAVIAGTLGEEQLIYHCVDEYTAFSGVHSQALAALEEGLCRRADLVLVSADLLYQ